MEEMQPHEFLVFMCRITHEHYKSTVYANELMYVKLEALLPAWLHPVYAAPVFGFKSEFEYDIK